MILNPEFQISIFFGIFPQIFLEIWKFFRVCYFWSISMYGASFQLNYSYWNWFCTQNIKFLNFTRNFLEIPEIFWKSGNFVEFAILVQFQCIWHHFHLILVNEIDFALRISNFLVYSGAFSRCFWKYGYHLEFVIFGQF